MGNTLDMAKIKEDHQNRTLRLVVAAQAVDNAASEVGIAAALMELAAIWREEANRLSELPSPKPRGWKTTMESLRDCATRVSGVAVAMRNHGLPDAGLTEADCTIGQNLAGAFAITEAQLGIDSGPKETRTTAGASTLANGAQAAALPAAGVQLDQAQTIGESSATERVTEQLALIQGRQDGKGLLQRDLQAVHDGQMTAEEFRAKWPELPKKVMEDQMVEFLKNRKGDAGPKASASPSIDTHVSGADGNTLATTSVARPHPSDDPAGDFLRDLGRGPSKLVEMVHQESLAEAANAIIEQVRTRVTDHSGAQYDVTHSANMTVQALDTEIGGQPATVFQLEGFGKSEGALKTWDPTGVPDPGPIMITYDPYTPPSAESTELLAKAAEAFYGQGKVQVLPEGHEVQITPGSFTIGAADAPPAWAALPAVDVIELDAVPTLPSPTHTSVSQANMVSECALKWKLAKRHGAPERPGWALVGGKAFHACIEAIESTGWDGNVARLWQERFTSAIFETSNENPLFPIDTWHASNKGKEDRAWWDADGPEMVHHYLAWRAKWVADGWELLKTAAGAPVVELEFLAFLGGSPVKGFIDSGWYHKGRNMIAIVDWKSGTSKPADYFQQATYRHALEPLLGWARPQGLVQWLGAFWDARSGELGPLVDLDVRHPKAEVEMRLSMPRRIDAAGLYMPNVNTGYGGCGSCSLKRSCPVGSRIGTGEVKL